MVIERGLEKTVADAKLREFEERGHKQHYWLEKERSGETQMNLVVIRARDIDAAKAFYEKLGLKFEREKHGGGPEHYACQSSSSVFEIYPLETESSAGARLGFSVESVDSVVESLQESGYEILNEPKNSKWGRRAVVADPDNHRVELVSSHGD